MSAHQLIALSNAPTSSSSTHHPTRQLHNRMDFHCDNHPLFRKVVDEEEVKADPVVPCVLEATEEGQKVSRGQGSEGLGKHLSIYERVAEAESADRDFDFWEESLSAGGGGDFRNTEAAKQAREKLGKRRQLHPVDRAKVTAVSASAEGAASAAAEQK